MADGAMSLLVFAGAPSLSPLPCSAPAPRQLAIVSTVFMVNLRHLLMSSALSSISRCLPPLSGTFLPTASQTKASPST